MSVLVMTGTMCVDNTSSKLRRAAVKILSSFIQTHMSSVQELELLSAKLVMGGFVAANAQCNGLS